MKVQPKEVQMNDIVFVQDTRLMPEQCNNVCCIINMEYILCEVINLKGWDQLLTLNYSTSPTLWGNTHKNHFLIFNLRSSCFSYFKEDLTLHAALVLFNQMK